MSGSENGGKERVIRELEERIEHANTGWVVDSVSVSVSTLEGWKRALDTGSYRTRVGHCKQDETDVYVGRGPNGRHMESTPHIHQRGWLGNPHPVDNYGREESILRFRESFEHRLAYDSEFREAVGELAGSVLGCWCQRLDEDGPACHAEIIAEHAERIARDLGTDGDTP